MSLFKKKEISEEEIKQLENDVLNEFNVFEGILCEVEFPNKQLKIGTHSGLTKGVATLTFGLIGLAATSGIKHNEEKRKFETIFQIVDKGIVFKNATMDSKDLRIPYSNIISATLDDDSYSNRFYINLLENQKINLRLFRTSYFKIVINHVLKIVNERACGAQYEETGWGLEHATKEQTDPENKQENNSLMDELERLGNMYEKGLLTDEEFTAMKKKLIEE